MTERWDEPSRRRRRDDERPLTAGEAARSSYYGVPVIRKPHLKWLIIVYFFLGGIAGAAYLIAAFADVVGPSSDRRIVRAGRYLSLVALIPSPILLILDLGQPARFLNMLRVVKLRSPMSVGTWELTIFGGFCALTAALQAAQDGLPGTRPLADRVSPAALRRVSLAGTPFACLVGGYTGALLAATAVPLWTKRALLLGPLFLTSAISTGISAITAVLTIIPGTDSETLRRLERLEQVAILSELILLAAWPLSLGATARPLTEGRTGRIVRHGTVGAGLALPLLLQALGTALPQRAGRRLSLATSLLVLAGGFALRYAVVVGGHASADDPQATFELTKKPHPGRSEDTRGATKMRLRRNRDD